MNIAEILRNCPKGMKLYSPIFGEVYLFDFSKDGDIWVKASDNSSIEFFKDGKYSKIGECLLFPSKENRDWSTFNPYSATNFPIGSIIKCKDTGSLWLRRGVDNISADGYTCCIGGGYVPANEEETKAFFMKLNTNGYIWDADKLELRKRGFRKGDFVYRELRHGEGKWISIHYGIDDSNRMGDVITFADMVLGKEDVFDINNTPWPLCWSSDITYERLATKGEKQQLLEALDREGFLWDAEKLELRKKEHQFKPFEKVLDEHGYIWDAEKFEVRKKEH